jgi:hypothetical protein
VWSPWRDIHRNTQRIPEDHIAFRVCLNVQFKVILCREAGGVGLSEISAHAFFAAKKSNLLHLGIVGDSLYQKLRWLASLSP